jgi:hypothetical protein
VLLCLTEIKLNYFKDTDTQQDAFRKDYNTIVKCKRWIHFDNSVTTYVFIKTT